MGLSSSRAALPVVEAGQARAVIVQNSEGGRVTALAVQELRDHVEALTGVKLPVVSAAEWDREAPGTFLVVGRGAALDALGVDLGELPREGLRILALPEHRALVLAGRDSGDPLGTAAAANLEQEYGTLYAVYELLERWGVRWYFPGALGAVLPRSDSLSAPELDWADSPDFAMRNFWLPASESLGGAPQGATSEERQRLREWQREIRLWALRNRAGNSTSEYHTRHHAPDWWSLWSETHPEYLALWEGRRGLDSNPERSKLCVSHPGTAEAVAELARRYFRAGGRRRSYSICEQDGSGGFCTCEACRAWDAAPDPGATDAPSLSDRYARFWNRVAESLVAEFPDRCVGVYLYGRYGEPPCGIAALHPNIRPVLVHNYVVDEGFFRRRIEGWRKLTAAPIGLYTVPLPGAYGMNLFSYPWLSLDAFAAGMRSFRDQGVVGFRATDFAIRENWITAAPMHHLVGRLAWNADADPRAILREFCEKLFGPAAEPMHAYFMALDAWQRVPPAPEEGEGAETAGAAPDEDGVIGRPVARELGYWLSEWSPGRIADLRQALDRAWQAAATDMVRERVARFQDALRFVELDTAAARAFRAHRAQPAPERWARLRDTVRVRQSYLDALPPWAGVVDPEGLRREAVARGYEVNADDAGEVFRDVFADGGAGAWRRRAGFAGVEPARDAPGVFRVRGKAVRTEIVMDRGALVGENRDYQLMVVWRAAPPARLQVRVVGGETLLNRVLPVSPSEAERRQTLAFRTPVGVERVRIYLNLVVPSGYDGAPLEIEIAEVFLRQAEPQAGA